MRTSMPSIVVVILGLALAGGPVAGQQSESESTVTPEQFDRWMTEHSNWGRWGDDDELGTINLITPAKRIQAASLVSIGTTVSLSRRLVLGRAVTFQRGFANRFALGGPGLGDRVEWIEELHQIGYHGSPLTHLDALCHVSWDGKTYNGRSFDATANVSDGCTRNGVAPLKAGIVTRGILMDLPSSSHVRAADIMAWERSSGISIGAGDALLLRTAGGGAFDNSVMPFIRERDIALLLADRGVVDGGAIEGRTTLPMHVFTLVALGMPLIDGVDLDELAETATALNRWEFMFVIAPLPVDNGAGSAVNPVAIF